MKCFLIGFLMILFLFGCKDTEVNKTFVFTPFKTTILNGSVVCSNTKENLQEKVEMQVVESEDCSVKYEDVEEDDTITVYRQRFKADSHDEQIIMLDYTTRAEMAIVTIQVEE